MEGMELVLPVQVNIIFGLCPEVEGNCLRSIEFRLIAHAVVEKCKLSSKIQNYLFFQQK